MCLWQSRRSANPSAADADHHHQRFRFGTQSAYTATQLHRTGRLHWSLLGCGHSGRRNPGVPPGPIRRSCSPASRRLWNERLVHQPGRPALVKVWKPSQGTDQRFTRSSPARTNTCTVASRLSAQSSAADANHHHQRTASARSRLHWRLKIHRTADTTAHGGMRSQRAAVTLAVSSWTTPRLCSPASPAAMERTLVHQPGDQLSVKVWNAQTGLVGGYRLPRAAERYIP